MTPDPLDRFANRRNLFGPSPADRLLANTSSVRLDLNRSRDDNDKLVVTCAFKLIGCIDLAPDVATGELLLGIVKDLGAERAEGDGA